MEAIGPLMIFAGLTLAYFFPTFVAVVRSHHNLGSIAVVNVFLGWTFIGWVVALAMAAGQVQRDDAPPPAPRRRRRR